jgi:hypothetical protein
MARPRKVADTVRVDITLSLTAGEDDDLIAWFAALPDRGRATAVITRLRTGTITATAANGQVSQDEAIATLFGMTM